MVAVDVVEIETTAGATTGVASALFSNNLRRGQTAPLLFHAPKISDHISTLPATILVNGGRITDHVSRIEHDLAVPDDLYQ